MGEIIEEKGPSLLLDETVLVTGQVERVTDFEKGFPPQQARTEHGWEPDPWLWDDQAVVCHVKDKGLLVLSACSSAGRMDRPPCSASRATSANTAALGDDR